MRCFGRKPRPRGGLLDELAPPPLPTPTRHTRGGEDRGRKAGQREGQATGRTLRYEHEVLECRRSLLKTSSSEWHGVSECQQGGWGEIKTWLDARSRPASALKAGYVREREGGNFSALPCHLRLQRALGKRLQPSNIQTNTLPAPAPATYQYAHNRRDAYATFRAHFDCDTYGSAYKHAHQQERGNSSRGHSRSASVMGTWLSIEPRHR